MTLFEAYESAFNERNDKLKGRYKTDFSYWNNGKGPSEQNQIKTLLKLGYTNPKLGVWEMPEDGFKKLDLVTITVDDSGIEAFKSRVNFFGRINTHYTRVGSFHKVHAAGFIEYLDSLKIEFDKSN